MAEKKDVVVIGAGPAGLAAALYASRAIMDTIVLEAQIVGGQIVEAYEVDNYPGFSDGISGPDLCEGMQKHAEKFGARIVYEQVTDITLENGWKRVKTTANEYLAPIVIVASGASHRKVGVEGEERLSGKGVSYCATCDGPFFRDKRLIVVGGGDAAVTESIFLTRFASEIKLVHRRQGFRAQAINLEEARKNEKLRFVLDSIVTEIHGEQHVEGVTVRNVKTQDERRLDCEGVFISIGHEPNTAFLKSLLPAWAGGLVPVDYNMETEVKGVYAVGDVRKGSFRQLGTAVGDGIAAAIHGEHRTKTLLDRIA